MCKGVFEKINMALTCRMRDELYKNHQEAEVSVQTCQDLNSIFKMQPGGYEVRIEWQDDITKQVFTDFVLQSAKEKV